jgi:hypothetical protein
MSAFPTSGTGIDAAGSGTAFATTWASGPFNGVEFVNNGSMFLVVLNATASVHAYHLIGQKAGGQVQPYTTYTTNVPNATGVPGWLGPWSVQQFAQSDGAQFAAGSGTGGAAPGGLISASSPSGVGYCCIDFDVTTTLAVRLYQLIPALP